MATPWACRPPPWTWAPWTHTRGWCGCQAGGRPPRLPSGPSPGSAQGGSGCAMPARPGSGGRCRSTACCR
jgi:hypothetical protein